MSGLVVLPEGVEDPRLAELEENRRAQGAAIVDEMIVAQRIQMERWALSSKRFWLVWIGVIRELVEVAALRLPERPSPAPKRLDVAPATAAPRRPRARRKRSRKGR